MTKRPIIGVTMGDPCGNGPEITIKALSDPELYRKCRPIVIGDAACMQYALETAERIGVVKKGTLAVHLVHSVDEALFTFGSIDVYDLGIVTDISDRKFGIACPLGGEAAFQYVKKVIELAMEGQVDATVTNALSKEAINMAGHHFSGHTEIYAHFTGTEKYTMMLAHENLRVVHVSTHVSLREACDRVKKDRVLDCIRIANDGCRSLGIQSPKVAVAGLNPHCGEDGLFGREEIDEIQPAINAALAEGICIPDGKPTPADTVFSKAIGGWYDIVVCMYHDQGHIPLKVKGFVYNREAGKWDAVAGVNVTLGLPIIRTSVDHGTGFGHAGQGYANELSLVNAKEHPGEVKLGTTGVNTVNYADTLRLMKALGIENDITVVPFDGGSAANTALLGNQIQLLTMSVSDTKSYVASGDFYGLVVFGEDRAKALPDTPCSKELGIDITTTKPRGYYAPAGTSQEVLDLLADAIEEVTKTEEFATLVEGYGWEINFVRGSEMQPKIEAWAEELAPVFQEILNAN